jgi:hypothetical protein
MMYTSRRLLTDTQAIGPQNSLRMTMGSNRKSIFRTSFASISALTSEVMARTRGGGSIRVVVLAVSSSGSSTGESTTFLWTTSDLVSGSMAACSSGDAGGSRWRELEAGDGAVKPFISGQELPPAIELGESIFFMSSASSSLPQVDVYRGA